LAPLIPFAKIPELPLTFLTWIPGLDRVFDPAHPPSIKPFGTLVALGVYIGSVIAMRHGRQRGFHEKKLSEFVFFVIGLGFVGGHVLDAVFYHPDAIRRDPLYIIKLWEGLSSYGGFIGSVLGALIWRLRRKEPVLPMVDMIDSAFPLAWVFGRAGCASVHDHPGMRSDAWYAVQWPLPNGMVEGRLDLGLIEMVLTIPLALTFLWLWKRNPYRPFGFYTGWMCIAYAPVRFLLDFLRVNRAETGLHGIGEGDPRYGGLTPAQWACFGFLALGFYVLHLSKKYAAEGPKPPEVLTRNETDEEPHDDEDDGEAERPQKGGEAPKAE
jgi:phosphatidylglycerol:prolipoprotein diacylglycerol transferase